MSTKTRSIAFGSMGAGATIVFALLIILGSGEGQSTSRTVPVPEGQVTEVQGVSCTGSIEYHRNGKLKFCRLAREDTLSGQTLAAGTGVRFTDEGVFKWCMLPQNTSIQGVLCRGDGHGFMTEFHPNGQLKTAYLAEDEVVQGIPCAQFRFLSAVFAGFHGKFGGTSFHANGQLRYCELSRNTTIAEISFRRGAAIRFDPDGKLMAKK